MNFADRTDTLVNGFAWPVFPVWRNATKAPCCAGGRNAATLDPDVIRAWGESFPDANVGVPTGVESGVVVIDVDGPDGEKSLASLRRFGSLPGETLSATSGRGRHLYFQHMGGRVVNRAGLMVRKASKVWMADEWEQLPGLDVRGDGGSIVVPPSVHHTGREYRWIDLGVGIALLPIWLMCMLGEKREARRPPEAHGGERRPPDMDRILDQLAGARPGQRNAALNNAAFRAGAAVRGGGVSEREAERALLAGAVALGLNRIEAVRTIQSGLRGGILRAR